MNLIYIKEKIKKTLTTNYNQELNSYNKKTNI